MWAARGLSTLTLLRRPEPRRHALTPTPERTRDRGKGQAGRQTFSSGVKRAGDDVEDNANDDDDALPIQEK